MRCPKCNEEIDRLNNYQAGEMYYKFSLDFGGKRGSYEEGEFIGGDEAGEYECPDCSTILAWNEKDALNFLRGEISEEMAKYYLELALKGKD